MIDLEKENLFLLNFQIANLRNNFISMNFPSFGDLFSNDLSEVEKTVNWLILAFLLFFYIIFKSFSEILLQRHREIQSKIDMMDNFRRLESELNYYKSQNERLSTQKNQMEKEIKNNLNKFNCLEKTYKETMYKIFLNFFTKLIKI